MDFQETDNIDLLIVSLKYGALPTALDTIKQATSQNTIVMSLMNGVDSEEIIGAKIGMSHILPALIKVASHKEPDGYLLIASPQLALFLESINHHFKVNESKQSAIFLKRVI